MKLKLLYVLPLLAILTGGCLGGGNKTAPTPIPDGTYSGQFRLLHIHTDRITIDTVKTNIVVYMSPSSTYTVTGDTSTVHAGSKGSFRADPVNNVITFTDNTYSSTAPVTKTHLTGTYAYAYDGVNFKMEAYGAQDTLRLQYDLKKTGN
ncbi:hypothetical protein [Mucilaginibacter sp.]|uniref:hypothetical protein n=1 Tax=Mucilaginibacter sp. TaxID=1882438 RepID=UPI00261C73FD|nr:hypothetical protein [Mucilaginibacter sp.]MDB4921385.1 hypothetical protein [Mucilaginibacter sp.]